MPKFAANLTMLFNEVDFLERFAAAKEAGFAGVEYLFPYDYDANELRERLEANGLTQVLHNLPAGDWAAGDRGIACLPDRVGEFLDGVGRAIDYASALGCKQVNCLAGIAPEGSDPEALTATLVENLTFAAAKLEAAGIRLVIEPINTRDIPGFFLKHTAEGVAVIEAVGSANLGLQYDIYHMQIMEGDLAPTIAASLDIIGHMQLADTPGRHESGTGEINFPFLLAYLDEVGYEGWMAGEYVPSRETGETLDWARPYLRAHA